MWRSCGPRAETAALATLEAGLKALGWPHEGASAAIHLQLRCLNLLALLYATQGRLRRAKELGQAAHELAERFGPAGRDRAIGARVALAWAYLEQGETVAARRWATLAQSGLDRNADTVLAPLLALVQARLLHHRGQRTEAFLQLEKLRADSLTLPDWVRQRIGLETADIQLALGNPDVAETILDTLPDHGSTAGAVLGVRAAALRDGPTAAETDLPLEPEIAPKVRVDALLTQACSLQAAGHVQSAVRAFQRAVQIAEPEQLTRPFTEAPPQLRKLIRSTLSRDARIPSRLNPKRAPAVPVFPRSGSSALSPTSAFPVGELTERESEVLRYLAQMLSTQEIAAAMFVSVNTVRSHIRGILRKLNAPRRNLAVRRARELHLV